jgi:hypothetical protein
VIWAEALSRNEFDGAALKAQVSRLIAQAARRRLRRSGRDLTGPLDGKQAAAIMDQALKAVRSHIEGRDIERGFVSCRGLGALGQKDLVYLTLDFRQVRCPLRCSYAATDGIK